MTWSNKGAITEDYKRKKELLTGLEEETKSRMMSDTGEGLSMLLKKSVLWRKGNLPNTEL